MRLHKLFFCLIATFLIILTGCSNKIENEEQKIAVSKRVGNENKYEGFRGINDSKQVLKVKEILSETDWQNAKVDMSRPADYLFVFKFINPEIKAKAVLYRIWISPNKDKLEIVKGESQYAHLTKENSAILFKIITGDELVKKG